LIEREPVGIQEIVFRKKEEGRRKKEEERRKKEEERRKNKEV